MTSFSGSIMCQNISQNSVKCWLICTSLLLNKRYDKVYRWTNQVKIHTATSRRVPNRNFCHWEVECTTLPACGYVHQSRNSPNPTLLGFLWKFHYIGRIDIYSTDSHSPLTGEWGMGLKYPSSKPWLALLGDQTSSWSYPSGLLNSKRFRSSVSETVVGNQILEKKMFPMHHFRNFNDFSISVPIRGTDTYFYY